MSTLNVWFLFTLPESKKLQQSFEVRPSLVVQGHRMLLPINNSDVFPTGEILLSKTSYLLHAWLAGQREMHAR